MAQSHQGYSKKAAPVDIEQTYDLPPLKALRVADFYDILNPNFECMAIAMAISLNLYATDVKVNCAFGEVK